jgi:hypothetical protein
VGRALSLVWPKQIGETFFLLPETEFWFIDHFSYSRTTVATEFNNSNNNNNNNNNDRLCDLVVRVLGYRSGGPGSIPGTTRKKN